MESAHKYERLHPRRAEGAIQRWEELLASLCEEQITTLIYESNHEKPWSEIRQIWKEGFLRFLELGVKIPERDLLDTGRYLWLKGYSLAFILVASHDHHQEHIEKLISWKDQQ